MCPSANLSISILNIPINISISTLVILMKAFCGELKRIISHEGLHIVYHPNDKGSWYNIVVKWGTGGTIKESLTIIIRGDTVKCAFYVGDGQ